MNKKLLKKIIVEVLTFEAKLALKRYSPKIILVTGTVGKTSTKDAIYTALSPFVQTRKSEKSFNSEIGVPLTILGLPNAWNNPFLWLFNFKLGILKIIYTHRYPKVLILEIGADAPGDIKRTMRWLVPDIVVVSQLSAVPVHVENYSSPNEVIEEEISPIRTLNHRGLVIWNKDDEISRKYVKSEASFLTYGFSEEADIWASHEEIIYKDKKPIGVGFRVDYSGTSIPIRIFGAVGVQHVYPVLSGIAVGISQGENFVSLAQKFESHKTPNGRMKILSGKNNSIIIDDSYNSSPIALRRALETVENLKTEGKKIAVLGDMLELGEYSEEEHKKLGVIANKVCDIVISVGKHSRDFAGEKYFEKAKEAGEYVSGILKEGDIVLVKGSQGIRLEKAIECFMSEPEKKKDLLVRQDKEWVSR